MRESFGYKVKSISDHAHKELLPDEVFNIFKESYCNISSPVRVSEAHFVQGDEIGATVTLEYNGKRASATNSGNGRLDAVSNAVRSYIKVGYTINTYTEHALEVGSASQAVSYVEIISDNGKSYWGTGIDTDIIKSSIYALVSAVNNMMRDNSPS